MYSGVGITGSAGLGDVVWQWMSTTNDPNLSRFQVALNKELTARGFKPIGTDGQLGPATCGALAWLGTLNDVDYSANPDLRLGTLLVSPDGGTTAVQTNPCKGFTYPTKVGSTTPFKPTSTFSEQLPWGVFDARTAQLQLTVNEQLDAHGYQPIPTGGTLDAPTCGAMKLSSDLWGVDFMTAYGKNCQGFVSPKQKVAAPPPVAPPPKPPGPTTSLPVHHAASSQAWMVGGLVAAAVAAGIYVATKKR